MTPQVTLPHTKIPEEGLHKATCNSISFEFPYAADTDDAVYLEKRGCPPMVVANFSIPFEDRKTPRCLFRRYDPLTPEGRSALHELTRSLLDKPFNGLIDLSGLQGRPCTLVVVHREVRGTIYPSILAVLPTSSNYEEPFAW